MITKWDLRFLDMAKLVAGWSKDPRTKVGCVIVRQDKTIASVGFNGLPRGIEDLPGRLYDRDTKHKLILHAEENALAFHRQGSDGGSLTLYTWPVPPCSQCACRIIQAGICRVVSPKLEADPETERYLDYSLTKSLFEEAHVIYETAQ